MSKVISKIRRVWLQIRMLTIRDGWKKAAYLKKHNIFHYMGENCYYAPIILPAEPELVSLANNVVISAGVRLITHSVAHIVYNQEEHTNRYLCRFGKIDIKDNVYIGADAIIQFDVTVEQNCIVAAGAVVTKDVKADSVVAGIPANKIGTYMESKQKSLEFSELFKEYDFDGDTWVSDMMKSRCVKFDD